MFQFRGLIAPVFAPFDSNKKLNVKLIPEYAEYLKEKGIKGVLVNGTSGEGMSMNVKERKEILEKWIEAYEGTEQHVMVQIGGAPLPDVIELAQHAEKVHADSILCLPDLYIKPKDEESLARYLKEISDAAPNTPILYYHIPSFTNVNINMGSFMENQAQKIPNFSGIKFTSTMLDEGVLALKAHGGNYAVFLGADTVMLGAYALGFDSAIATTFNIFPELGIGIQESFKQNDLTKAGRIQEKLTETVENIVKYGEWVPTMKRAMNRFTPIKVGDVREPMKGLSESDALNLFVDVSGVLEKK